MRFRGTTLVAALLLSLSPFALSQGNGVSTTPPSPNTSDSPTKTDAPQPATVSQDGQTSSAESRLPNVKPGGKDDVNAIGNRAVGKGSKLGNWYSLETEIRMGKELAQQVEQNVKLVRDPVVNEYVNRIGQNLVRNSDARVPFTIKVVDDDSINAFALPGGFFYVNSGLILAADEEAELAGVMAHEIAHVAARHGTRQMTRGQLANFATIPLIFVGGGLGYALQSAAGLALPLTFMTFSRNFEADPTISACSTCTRPGTIRRPFLHSLRRSRRRRKKNLVGLPEPLQLTRRRPTVSPRPRKKSIGSCQPAQSTW